MKIFMDGEQDDTIEIKVTPPSLTCTALTFRENSCGFMAIIMPRDCIMWDRLLAIDTAVF